MCRLASVCSAITLCLIAGVLAELLGIVCVGLVEQVRPACCRQLDNCASIKHTTCHDCMAITWQPVPCLPALQHCPVSLASFSGARPHADALHVWEQVPSPAWDGKVRLDLPLLINANFVACAALISVGAYLGKATPTQVTMSWVLAAAACETLAGMQASMLPYCAAAVQESIVQSRPPRLMHAAATLIAGPGYCECR